MISHPIEAEYPQDFRKDDCKALAEMISQHQSVELVGMKRVGISNFLRFFLYNEKVREEYFGQNQTVLHDDTQNKAKTRTKSTSQEVESFLFIPVDCNNLIELERYPFWLLTFKRILDSVEHSELPGSLKQVISKYFDTAIQYKETFFIVDGIRKAIVELTRNNVTPVIFMLRFDRLLEVITPELFNNLQGLYDASGGKLVYIFTTYRRLYHLKPEVFDINTMSVFAHPIYVKPAQKDDAEIIFDTFEAKYNLNIEHQVKEKLIQMTGGHVNYLQLALIIVKERMEAGEKIEDILDVIQHDERIELQSEELFSYLEHEDQAVLQKVVHKTYTKEDGFDDSYVWHTGMIANGAQPPHVFSPLFEQYVKVTDRSKAQRSEKDELENLDTVNQESENKSGSKNVKVPSIDTYLTSKEYRLFTLLKEHVGTICERDLILEVVWAEYEAIGVSDWAVDRLVARLRKKLHDLHSEYTIKTIRTRGFMLLEQAE